MSFLTNTIEPEGRAGNAPVMTNRPQHNEMTSKGCHVLIIDDLDDNRMLLSRSLRERGYCVSLAENGPRGLEMLKSQLFHLVLLDIMMPEMSGYEVLKAIRADNVLQDLPVVVISAMDESDGLTASLELKADDYLTKPFNEAALIARISACLERKRMRDLEIEHLKQIEKEKKHSDELLRVILPNSIAEELKATNTVKSRRCKNVAVLFADVVDFVNYCDCHEPDEVLAHLQEMVTAFERLAEKHGLQKIKTIGDCFLATGGLLEPIEKPVENCVKAGLEMIRTARSLAPGWDLRAGIHCGEVIAGIIGHRQYQFDIYGDTVNTAARVEKCGRAGAVNLSVDAWKQVSGQFQGQSIGVYTVKGKGKLEIFQVTDCKKIGGLEHIWRRDMQQTDKVKVS